MEHGWPRCEDNKTRDYCYGSCGTTRQYSNWTQTYLHRLVSSLQRVNFAGKVLLYIHPFISTESGAAQTYAEDRCLLLLLLLLLRRGRRLRGPPPPDPQADDEAEAPILGIRLRSPALGGDEGVDVQ
jgi:hypothetical protein